MRRLALLFVVVLLALPTALAHLEYQRPNVQGFQPARFVEFTHPDDGRARVEMLSTTDPTRQYVRHEVDVTRGAFSVEYRAHAPVDDDAFGFQLIIDRIVEFHDVNRDLRFDPQVDNVVRTWRIDTYVWTTRTVLDVRVADVAAKAALFNGTVRGGPNVSIEPVAAGRFFQDEGAVVLPQDVLYFVDIDGLPPRPAGNLFALDGRILAPVGAYVGEDVAPQNVSTSVLVHDDGRLAHFTWGGQASVAGEERFVETLLGEGQVQDGVQTHTFRMSLPPYEGPVRFAWTMGMEYTPPSGRDTLPEPSLALWVLAVVGAALVAGRFRRCR